MTFIKEEKNEDLKVGSIRKTFNYGKFGFREHNRHTSRQSVETIKKSFIQKQLAIPIIVDENYLIADGQNRYFAAQGLNLPIYYTIIEGITKEDIIRLNLHSSKWTNSDWLTYYLTVNENDAYKRYKEFQETYQIGHAITLLFFYWQSRDKKRIGENSHLYGYRAPSFKANDNFKEGTLAYHNDNNFVQEAGGRYVALARFIDDSLLKKVSFVRALLTIFENPELDFPRLLDKLEKQPIKLTSQESTETYLSCLQDVYNHNQKSNRSKIYEIEL